MNWSRPSSALALAALCLVSCGEGEAEKAPESGGYAKTVETDGGGGAAAAETPFASFTDVAGEWGVDFTHDNGARGGKYMPETLGGGVAVLDVDGDGRQDLFFVNSRPWPGTDDGARPTSRLFRNTGAAAGPRFEDVTADWGLDAVRFDVGVAVADYDADGDPDLFVT
ncbi:MAG: FG-GAP repeat domain-containing protein, partial [Planctomycetota bacterium]